MQCGFKQAYLKKHLSNLLEKRDQVCKKESREFSLVESHPEQSSDGLKVIHTEPTW